MSSSLTVTLRPAWADRSRCKRALKGSRPLGSGGRPTPCTVTWSTAAGTRAPAAPGRGLTSKELDDGRFFCGIALAGIPIGDQPMTRRCQPVDGDRFGRWLVRRGLDDQAGRRTARTSRGKSRSPEPWRGPPPRGLQSAATPERVPGSSSIRPEQPGRCLMASGSHQGEHCRAQN